MNRSIIAVVAALSFASLGGCAPTTIPVSAAALPSDVGVIVTGEGEASAKPDLGVIRIGVEAHRLTMAEAREASASAQNRILQEVRAHGITSEDIQTEQLSFAPEYEWIENKQKLRGYVATNIVRIKVKDLSKLGSIVDSAVKAGDNDVRVDGLSLELADPTEVRMEARKRALADAKKKAEQLAAELGVKLGEPIAIEETGTALPGPVFMRDAMMKAEGSSTPIEAGSVQARVGVRVRWAISK
jgi:uncharacterized protein YggE